MFYYIYIHYIPRFFCVQFDLHSWPRLGKMFPTGRTEKTTHFEDSKPVLAVSWDRCPMEGGKMPGSTVELKKIEIFGED